MERRSAPSRHSSCGDVTGWPAAGALLLCALLSACGGGSGDAGPDAPLPPEPPAPAPSGPPTPPPEDGPGCSRADQNGWAYANMQDYYLFYDQVPLVDPADFASADELVRAVRFEERDPFSFVSKSEASSLELDEGREFGLGYRLGEHVDGTVRIVSVVGDSPFGRAGIERGDIVTEIAGRPASEALRDAAFFGSELFGTPESPAETLWGFRDRDTGVPFERRMLATEYAIDTVRHVDWYTDEAYDGRVGYFRLSRFLETSVAELDATFDELERAGITDLVLDLRYNLGGRVSVAQQLASRIVDDAQAGAVLQRYRYNDKYAESENFELEIIEEVAGLGLRRLVVLTDPSTASASELVINGLDPLMDVQVIGTFLTAGKPYIQFGRNRCGERLNAIEAEAVNSVGESVFGGIRPDCFAEDNWDEGFGYNENTDRIETMLLAGLDLAIFGTCEPYVDLPAKRAASSLESWRGQGVRPTGGALAER